MQKNGSPGWTHLPIFPVVLSWILVINSCLGKNNKQDKYWVASSILQAEFERHGRPDKYMAVARSWFPTTAGWSEVATAALIPASAPTYCHRESMTEKGCACFSAIAIHSLHTDVRVPRRDWLIQNTCSSCSRKLHFRSSGFSFYLSFLIFRYLGHSLFPPHPTDYGFLKTLTIRVHSRHLPRSFEVSFCPRGLWAQNLSGIMLCPIPERSRFCWMHLRRVASQTEI